MRLRKPCEHGRYDPHGPMVGRGDSVTVYDFSECSGGEFLAEDTLVIETAMPAGRLERQRNDELRAALGKGHMAPWEQDIERLLNRGDSILDALAVREGEG